MRPHFQFPFLGRRGGSPTNPANAVEIDPRRTSAAKSMVIETASRLAPAYTARSNSAGATSSAGNTGGHRFKDAIVSNQCVEQGGCDMQQDTAKMQRRDRSARPTKVHAGYRSAVVSLEDATRRIKQRDRRPPIAFPSRAAA